MTRARSHEQISVTFTLATEDLEALARFSADPEDPETPSTDDLLKLWTALACGGDVDGTYIEPDYEAWSEFIDGAAPIWRKIRLSALERLAEAGRHIK